MSEQKGTNYLVPVIFEPSCTIGVQLSCVYNWCTVELRVQLVYS